MKECQIGVERKPQGEAAVSAAIALHRQFTVLGDMLNAPRSSNTLVACLRRMMTIDNAQGI
jgi:hypothetical protein